MQFSTAAIFTAVAGSAIAGYANSTVTEVGTTIITITSCHEEKCTPVPVTTGVVTVTDIHTTYTTYCPLPTTEGESTKAAESTSAANTTAPSVSTAEAGAGANAAPVVAAGLLALGAFM